MNLNVQELVPFFGFSIEAPDVRSKLIDLGFDAEISLPTLRKLGSQQIADEARGIVLMLSERAKFERLFGAPRSVGEAILSAVSVYPSGFKKFSPYAGQLGESLEGITTATQLRNTLGKGDVRDEDDGIVFEESWRIGEINLFGKYTDDGKIVSLQFNLPMKAS